jgi:hypothetical protein
MMMRYVALALCGGLALTGCPEPDPEGTNNPTENNPTENNPTENNPTGEDPEVLCDAACAALTGCAAAEAACGGDAGALIAACESVCDGGDAAALAALSDDACTAHGVELLVDAAGLRYTCDAAQMCADRRVGYYESSDTAGDDWDACVSDDSATVYARFNETISSAGRIGAFEQIADVLWRIEGDPSPTAFVDARELYAVDEGLDSRVQRREDEHYPPVTDGEGNTLRCRDEGVPEMDPDRCVGPAQILPILNDAFAEGAAGEDPKVNAARIEAALVWFFYVSTHKETVTCAAASKDCDSSYAYYTGDRPRGEGIGLAGYYRRLAPDAHEAVWDGLLAQRCWRDQDDAEQATDMELMNQALDQLDAGLLYGFARVVAARLSEMSVAVGDDRAAAWAFVQIAGPVLQRSAEERDAGEAATLAAAWGASSADDVDVDATLQALQALYPCP